MEIRLGVGMPTGMSPRLRRCALTIMLIGGMLVTAGLPRPVQAADPVRQVVRPLAYHATVYNGELVGSAFALAPGIAVTNGHVVEGLAPGVAPPGVSRRSRCRHGCGGGARRRRAPAGGRRRG